MPLRHSPGPHRAVVAAAVMIGITVTALALRRPELAVATGTIAAAAMLAVLRHLVAREEQR